MQLKKKFENLYRLLGFSGNPTQAVKIAQYYHDVFDGEAGKHVLADLADRCKVWVVDDTNLMDTQRTAFNEGQRSVFLHIAAMRGLNNKDYIEFIDEVRKILNGNSDSGS